MRSLGRLLLCLIPVLLVQVLSAWTTVENINPWYQSINKAPWTPPNWVFGPVWSVLYLMMAVSFWMVTAPQLPARDRRGCVRAFLVQLLLNGLWSTLFFGVHAVGLALIDIVLLIAAVARCAVLFFAVRPRAAYLLLPYLAWISYAFTLNLYIWLNN